MMRDGAISHEYLGLTTTERKMTLGSHLFKERGLW
jgi:hypothetical protein